MDCDDAFLLVLVRIPLAFPWSFFLPVDSKGGGRLRGESPSCSEVSLRCARVYLPARHLMQKSTAELLNATQLVQAVDDKPDCCSF